MYNHERFLLMSINYSTIKQFGFQSKNSTERALTLSLNPSDRGEFTLNIFLFFLFRK